MNLKEIQAKLQAVEDREANRGKGNSDPNFFRPEEGDQKLRITPSPDGDSFQEIFMHFRVGGESFMCPKKNFGEKCAVCDFASELYKLGDEESRKQSSAIYAKPRYYSPVLVREQEEKGIRWWAYGVTVYRGFLKKILNPDYGDFSDPEKGFDWTLTYTPQDKSSTNFAQSDLTADRNSSKLTDGGKKAVDKLVSAASPLLDVLTRKTSEEVKDLLDKYLSKDPEQSSSEQEKYGDDNKTSLDKAFEGLKQD